MTANEHLSQVQCEEEIGRELNDGKMWGEKFYQTYVETGIHELRYLLTESGKSSVGLGPNYESGEVCLRCLITLLSLSFPSYGNLSPQILTDYPEHPAMVSQLCLGPPSKPPLIFPVSQL